jgi:PIN domain nuclease of toxin-antitoxin system
VRVLLDTHVFLWAIGGDERLSAKHRSIFEDGANELHLSVASVWELLIKAGLGKMPLPKPTAEYLNRQLERNRIAMLPIRTSHLAELEALPPLHRDPFDRLLAAQALAEGMPMLSVDRQMKQYRVELL